MAAKIVKPGNCLIHPTRINVRVGYGWMKVDEEAKGDGRAVLADAFWKTIRDAFNSGGFEKNNHAKVDFSRLRASHGKIVLPSVLEHIRESDILIFDVAESPEPFSSHGQEVYLEKLRKFTSRPKAKMFNSNVLIEIGAAIAMDKRIMLLCPEGWKDRVPSDLKCYMWTFYKWDGGKGKIIRRFVDQYGMQNCYIGMLRETLETKRKSDK